MPTPTYTPLATITLSSTDSQIVFANIPSTFASLVLVGDYTGTGSADYGILRFNNDSGGNYNRVQMLNNNNSAQSNSGSNEAGFYSWQVPASTTRGNVIFQIEDYKATDKHKTFLCRFNSATEQYGVFASAGRWANTSAITSISLQPNTGSFAIGSTFSLYGIAS